jgi:aryl-alcohol dehydrogenase-like predicted oxidoreductase
MYSSGESEKVLGKTINDFINREDVVIATNIFFPMRKKSNGRGLSRRP